MLERSSIADEEKTNPRQRVSRMWLESMQNLTLSRIARWYTFEWRRERRITRVVGSLPTAPVWTLSMGSNPVAELEADGAHGPGPAANHRVERG